MKIVSNIYEVAEVLKLKNYNFLPADNWAEKPKDVEKSDQEVSTIKKLIHVTL